MTTLAGEEAAAAGMTLLSGVPGFVVAVDASATSSLVRVILEASSPVEGVSVFGDRDRSADLDAVRRRRQSMAARARARRAVTSDRPDDPEVAAEQAAVARALREAQARTQSQS